MKYLAWIIILVFCAQTGFSHPLSGEGDGYVSVELKGQFGNQMFQIATAYAYALDHDLPLTIPDLVNKRGSGIPVNARELFLPKVPAYPLPYQPEIKWMDRGNNYQEIPDSNAIVINGWFQSEKFFRHRKQEIVELFAPPPGMNEKILAKYPVLESDVLTVGIQIRDYRIEQPKGKYHPTIGRVYYERAMALFPDDTLFIVSSNKPSYARECTEGLKPNIIYLDSKSYIEEFFTLVLCKSFIISNSTFGWWAAWLCPYENKRVITPSPWFALPFVDKDMTKDRIPPEWTILRYQ